MTAIRYPFGTIVPTETAVKITPEILWIRMPLPFMLNHVNVWLLKEASGWCAVDTGVSWDGGKACWEKHLEKHRLARQVVTHYHPDHIGLSGWLEEKTGASLWITQGEYLSALAYRNQSGNHSVDATIRLFESHGLDNPRLEALRERGNAYANGCPLIPATFHRLRDGEFIHIGEHVWEVIVGYGHAVEHASFYCRKLNVLVSGDMLLPSISTNVPVMASNPEGNPLKDFLDSIRRYCKLPEDTLVLPSHGRPFVGIHSRVSFLEEHHRKRCEAVLSACSVPRTACEILPILFEREITDAHQCLFAMGEAIAHLSYLEKQHKLEKREENRRIRFVAV